LNNKKETRRHRPPGSGTRLVALKGSALGVEDLVWCVPAGGGGVGKWNLIKCSESLVAFKSSKLVSGRTET